MKKEKKDEVVLKPGIFKMFLYFLMCFCFVLIGVFIIKSDADLFTKIIGGYGCIIFFGIGSLMFLCKLVSTAPTLIISSKGIYTNWSLFKELRKWIPWDEIEKIGKTKQNIDAKGAMVSQEYLVIYLKNPKKFNFNNEKGDSKNIFKKIIGNSMGYYNSNIGLKGDLYIPSSTLNHSLEEVLLILKKYPVKIEKNLEVINS